MSEFVYRRVGVLAVPDSEDVVEAEPGSVVNDEDDPIAQSDTDDEAVSSKRPDTPIPTELEPPVLVRQNAVAPNAYSTPTETTNKPIVTPKAPTKGRRGYDRRHLSSKASKLVDKIVAKGTNIRPPLVPRKIVFT